MPVAAPVVDIACAIFDPELFDAPLTPDCVTVQLNDVLPTLLVNAIDEVVPEQKVCELGVAVADGIGFTVTVAVIAEPAQPTAVGVIV